MRILTFLALAALAAGIYHYRGRLRPGRRALDQQAPDELLAERVRAGIADVASSPVNVHVSNGIVSLRGIVLRSERDLVLACVLAVPGVSQVTNHLESEEPVGELGAMQSGIATGI